MAFKMKGFPFAGKSPIKDITRGPAVKGNHNYAHMLHDEGKGPDPHAETKPLQQKEEKKQFPSPYKPGSKFATKWDELKTPLPQKEEKKEEKKKEKKKTKDKKYEEANSEEKKILDQMDALEAKMKKIKDKNSKEYKDLENKHRDLDSKLWSYD